MQSVCILRQTVQLQLHLALLQDVCCGIRGAGLTNSLRCCHSACVPAKQPACELFSSLKGSLQHRSPNRDTCVYISMQRRHPEAAPQHQPHKRHAASNRAVMEHVTDNRSPLRCSNGKVEHVEANHAHIL